MSEEQKEKMRLGREQAKLKKVEEQGGIKEEFEEFKKKTEEQNNQILGILETLVNKDKDTKTIDTTDLLTTKKVPLEEEVQALSGKQKELFERYFDPADGFKAWYNVNENLFTIEVPMSLSNTSEAHRTLYRQDLRVKKVDQNNILGSIDAYCKLVCSNLKYNRNIRLK